MEQQQTFFETMLADAEAQREELRQEIIGNAIDYFSLDTAFCEKFREIHGFYPDEEMEVETFVNNINAQFARLEQIYPGFRENVLDMLDEQRGN